MTTFEMLLRPVVLNGLRRSLAEHTLDLVVRISALDVDPKGTTTLAIRVREAREILQAMKELKP